jgi:uncharacterized SAM-binding protein YcdF (DUF218 family)
MSPDKIAPIRVRDARILVALGKNWKRGPGGLSIESKMSALAAGEIWTRGGASLLILSGGRTGGRRRPSEAEAMWALMLRCSCLRGIPESAVVLEDRAIDTAGNAEEVGRILSELGVSEAAILTVGYHLPAARQLFESFGVRVTAAIAAEEVLGGRSRHYGRFLSRWRVSRRVRVERGKELARRALLRVDPKGRVLRVITSVVRRQGD